MAKSSFDFVDFSVRPNKSVERKMLIEALTALGGQFDLREYRYVGLGSIWFVDFVMVHKQLKIDNLVSIEQDLTRSDRVEFNRPYNCVTVKMGDSTSVLRDLGLERGRSIVWLDYDSGIDGPWQADVEFLCQRVPSGSVVLVTLNAHREQLRREEDGKIFDREEVLRELVGDLVPADLNIKDLSARGFPSLIGRILSTHFKRSVWGGGREDDKFVPIFNFLYEDGAPMVTFGGMIVNAEDETRLGQCAYLQQDYLTGEEQFEIDVPPLTYKEKLALDRLMPSSDTPSPSEVKKLGFTLKEAQIRAYHRFYRFYPHYAEVR